MLSVFFLGWFMLEVVCLVVATRKSRKTVMVGFGSDGIDRSVAREDGLFNLE